MKKRTATLVRFLDSDYDQELEFSVSTLAL